MGGRGSNSGSAGRQVAPRMAAEQTSSFYQQVRAEAGRGARGIAPQLGALLSDRDGALRNGSEPPMRVAERIERRIQRIAGSAPEGTRLAIGRQGQLNDEVMVKRGDGWHFEGGRRRGDAGRAYDDREFSRIVSSASRIEEG